MNSSDIGRLKAWINERRAEMLSLLERFVSIQSGSYNEEGLARMRAALVSELRADGFSVNGGRHIVAANVEGDERAILLLGHFDTVFPENSAFRTMTRFDDRVVGPGVIDMKGGLVVILYALRALSALGLMDCLPVRIVFNADEEIGSVSSQQIILEQARLSMAVFVTECGGLENQVVTGRKGRTGYKLRVKGRAGHAAFADAAKASAVLDLSHRIIDIEKLNADVAGVTVNVGLVQGGIGANTVPEDAWALIDTRYATAEQGDKLRESLQAIADRQTEVCGTSAELEVTTSRPPMPQNEGNLRLYYIVESAAAALGYRIDSELRSGVSDANYVAEIGVPVIDGMGPVGAFDHSDKEYMLVESLSERTVLLALSIFEAWNQDIIV